MPINDELQQQLIKDLLIESAEGLDRFDREMLVLEKGAGTPETLNIIFRVIHTIKGTAGCLGLPKIESVAHVGENLLDDLRGGKLLPSPEMITTLLSYADALRGMLRCLETTGNEGTEDFSPLLKKLHDLRTPTAAAQETRPRPRLLWLCLRRRPRQRRPMPRLVLLALAGLASCAKSAAPVESSPAAPSPAPGSEPPLRDVERQQDRAGLGELGEAVGRALLGAPVVGVGDSAPGFVQIGRAHV